MFERYSEHARTVMERAYHEAQRMRDDHIGTEHILLGLLEVKEGFAADVLEKENIDIAHVKKEIDELVEHSPVSEDLNYEDILIHRTLHVQTVINDAVKEARKLNSTTIGTEHLLLGLLYENEGIGARVIQKLGLKLDDVRMDVLDCIKKASA